MEASSGHWWVWGSLGTWLRPTDEISWSLKFAHLHWSVYCIDFLCSIMSHHKTTKKCPHSSIFSSQLPNRDTPLPRQLLWCPAILTWALRAPQVQTLSCKVSRHNWGIYLRMKPDEGIEFPSLFFPAYHHCSGRWCPFCRTGGYPQSGAPITASYTL